MVSSWKTMIAAGGAVILLLAVPYVEEPWLLDRYGAAYLEYRKWVPRFIRR
jgi:protein-S-isoprenylcysteine O-methyltransferase Ste14